MNNDLITLNEAATIIAANSKRPYSPATLRSRIRFGAIPEAVKIGRDWFVPRAWAETYGPKRSK